VRVSAESAHNRWHADLEPVATVQPGEEITLETRDGLDGQLTRSSSLEDVLTLDHGLGHPLTGPVYVEGAKPGDVVDIELVAYETADFGVTAVIPGFGFLADEFTDPYLVTWEIADGKARSPELPGVVIAGDPFAGVIGVAPSHALMDEIARRSRMQAPPSPTRCRRRLSPPLAARASARFRRARSGETSTSASSSPARESRCRFTSRERSSRSATSTSPRVTAKCAAPVSRSPVR
jgi:acetamidase/formamidase